MVLCGSNGYQQNYYFNEAFSNLPETVKQELKIMCVWFTEECGGIFTMEYDPKGRLCYRHPPTENYGYNYENGPYLKKKQNPR